MFMELNKEIGDKHLIYKWFGYSNYTVIRHDTATLGLYNYGYLVATIDNTERLTITPMMHLGGITGRKAATYLLAFMPRNAVGCAFNQDNDRVVLTIGAKRYVVDQSKNVVIDFNCGIPEIKSETIPQYKTRIDVKAKNRVMKQWEDTFNHIRLIYELEENDQWIIRRGYLGSEKMEAYEKMDFSKPPSLEKRGEFVVKMLDLNTYDLANTLYEIQSQVLRTFKDFRTIKVAIPRGEI